MDVSGINDIEIHAHVTDDLGIKYEPLLLYAASDPGTPPDLGAMTQVSMTRQSGNQKDGEWLGRIPNPVAASGGTAELHYILVARDDDDAAADCDHLTQVPATGSFQIEVTAAGVVGAWVSVSPALRTLSAEAPRTCASRLAETRAAFPRAVSAARVRRDTPVLPVP